MIHWGGKIEHFFVKLLFCGTTNPQCDVSHILLCHKLWFQVHPFVISLCISDRFLFTLNHLSIYLFMHFNYSLCFVLFTYTQPCEHYRVHLYWVQVKLLWEGRGAIRDNRILVLVHSTKRESASLPVTGATKGASQKWYHAYKNNNRVTVRWWKTVNRPIYDQALMEIQKKKCRWRRSTWTSSLTVKNITLVLGGGLQVFCRFAFSPSGQRQPLLLSLI